MERIIPASRISIKGYYGRAKLLRITSIRVFDLTRTGCGSENI